MDDWGNRLTNGIYPETTIRRAHLFPVYKNEHYSGEQNMFIYRIVSENHGLCSWNSALGIFVKNVLYIITKWLLEPALNIRRQVHCFILTIQGLGKPYQRSIQQALPKECAKIHKIFRRGLNLLPRVD